MSHCPSCGEEHSILGGVHICPPPPKTYEDGLREMMEVIIELVNKNYAGGEAKSFRHAFKREIRRAALDLIKRG